MRTHARTLLAALQEAAEACIERASSCCDDCTDSEDDRCDTHGDDLAQADTYHRAFDDLATALGVRGAPQPDPRGPGPVSSRHFRLVHSTGRRPNASSLCRCG